MVKKKLSRKGIILLLILTLLVWRAWPLIPIFTGLLKKASPGNKDKTIVCIFCDTGERDLPVKGPFD